MGPKFFPSLSRSFSSVGKCPHRSGACANCLSVERTVVVSQPFKKWWRVIFPAALPFIVTGVRVGIAIGFIMVFVSELAGASSGLGYRISVSHLAYRIDDMMAALVVLGACGALADQLFLLTLRRAFPWLRFSLYRKYKTKPIIKSEVYKLVHGREQICIG